MMDHPGQDQSPMRVADALPNSWVYRFLPSFLLPYAQLARWDRPIGWWLLLWPCWWSFTLAIGAFFGSDPMLAQAWTWFAPPLVGGFLAFWVGAIAMRGAGCTYNDLVDVDIDLKVARTAARPIPSGRVSVKRVFLFIGLQVIAGALALAYLVMMKGTINVFALLLALASLIIVAVYPFAKRVTFWPQFVLGLAFSWGALMGWAVIFDELHAAPLLLYAAAISWTIGYDTIYAHQDREDDALVGVKSTARLFGEHTRAALLVLYTLALILMALAFNAAYASWPAYAGLAIGAVHMITQIVRLDIDDGAKCLKLFQSNSHFGWIIFAGLVAALFV